MEARLCGSESHESLCQFSCGADGVDDSDAVRECVALDRSLDAGGQRPALVQAACYEEAYYVCQRG